MDAWLATLPRSSGSRAAVLETSELRRIRDARWSPWDEAGDLHDLTDRLTAALRVPGCAGAGSEALCSVCGSPLRLRPIQAGTLRALAEQEGVLAPIAVGAGKTLLSLLAPTLLQRFSLGGKRPLLIVPASLRDKTRREAGILARHWQISPTKIVSYEGLGRVAMHHLLTNYEPDTIIADEAHFLRNPKAAVTRVVGTHVRAMRKRGTPPRQIYMSGSITSRTLRDYAHLARWALGDAAPLPRDFGELQQWCWALDEKVPEGTRVDPGALLQLADGEGADDLERARVRYSRRFRATPGIVASGSDMPPCGLQCRIEHLPPTEPMRAAVEHMRATWSIPDGTPFETAMDLWRHEREVSAGLVYRWRDPAPPEWLARRKAWSKFVRETLEHSRTIFTRLACATAIIEGRIDDGGVYRAWREIEPSFSPVTEPVWICDSTLKFSAGWLAREAGLCWVHHRAFGVRLAAETGVPYFSDGGRAGDISIDQHHGPAIASISSCGRGFNLQHHSKNLVVTSPTKGAAAEQLIGRTHRFGQLADDVEFVFLQRLEGDVQALAQARADARYTEATLHQPQRLGVATWT